MKVLFVYTLEVAQSNTKPIALLEWTQFGISYISAYLQQVGHRDPAACPDPQKPV